ncbi:alpha-L-glutamate ligase-like protein [Shimia biformata]|uniref:alpha-L-glutamate ligase-like protein n=1 Tax=Shimia biformata TaxID=1294299 RepID=UPI0019525609|nr:alpha-L-glutamate ligase-like protein [Shimia biformata]
MIRFASPFALRRAGIVGMNRRNVELIAQNNPRHLYPLVDNKLITKRVLAEHGLDAPTLIGAVRLTGQLRDLPAFLEPHKRFVIKPAQGSGGKGILVVAGRDGEAYLRPSGVAFGFDELARHVNNILSGLFSLGGKNDVAMIEEMIDFDPVFEGYSFEGVPDIRVIVYKGFPVMAMTRLSTAASDGKANLHQGAVGVGLDIATGRALRAVQFDKPVTTHPDTGADLTRITVPGWDRLTQLSARCFAATGLGYMGVDVVLDRQKGPQILELNARPGLAVQIANGRGMRPRIDAVEALLTTGSAPSSPDDRAAWAKEHIAPL